MRGDAGPPARAVLAASVTGAALVALDGTVLLIAQPRLGAEFRATAAQVQWTSTAYLLAVAALLVVAGRLGDRYGHVRLLRLGCLGFAAASAGIALAPGLGWIVGLRAAQGVCGALLQPATLALLHTAYPQDRVPGAVALRTAGIGIASAAGPLAGGALVASHGWRAVFVLNVPVALAVLLLTTVVRVPAATGPRPAGTRAGLLGPALLVAALAALVHTLSTVPRAGWGGGAVLLGLGGTAALGALLLAHERRTTAPLLPAAVARSRPVAASLALLLTSSAALQGTLFQATFVLQDSRGLGPLDAALRMAPLTVLMVLGAPAVAALLRRVGARRTALGGSALLVLGVAAVTGGAGLGGTGLALGAGAALLGAGFAAVMVTATGAVVAEAPAGYAGTVGGLKQSAAAVGPVLGIALASGGPVAHGSAGPRLAALAALGLVSAALLPDRLSPAATLAPRTGPAAPPPPVRPSPGPATPAPRTPDAPSSPRRSD